MMRAGCVFVVGFLCLAVVQGGFIETGKEYEYETEVRVGAGTMDYAPHTSGLVSKFKTRLQAVDDFNIKAEISGMKYASYNGPVDTRNTRSDVLNFLPAETQSVQFNIVLEKGLFKALMLPADLPVSMRNVIKAFAVQFQLNGAKMGAGERHFKSEEQTIHGACDITYTVTSDSIYKSVSHNKDCKNRAVRIVDDVRGYDCEWEDKDKADGLVSTANTIYTYAPEGSAHKITSISMSGSFVSQMFETEGVSHIVRVNSTSTLVATRPSSGDITAGTDLTNSLKYDFADSEYRWDTGRDLASVEPLFGVGGGYYFENVDAAKQVLLAGLAEQKNLLHSHTVDKDAIAKAHKMGINTLLFPMYAMDFVSLSSVYETLYADKTEEGVMQANIFTELLGATGTTAAALTVKHLLESKKFDNNRDATRAITAVPFHIRRPNTQLVEIYEELLTKDFEDPVKMAVPLAFGHLVRMTCERAGSEAKKCYTDFGSKYVKKYFDMFKAASSRSEKNMALAVMNNIRYGGQSEVLKPLIYGQGEFSSALSEHRAMAVWVSMREVLTRGMGMEVYFPIYADKNIAHEIRIAAVSGLMYARPSTTEMSQIVMVLKQETDYELINYVFALLEKTASSINPCDRKVSEVAGYFLKYLKQFSQYETDWGFGVSKTYSRQFNKKKYGYSGSYSFYTHGSHESTTPISVGMSIDSTLHHNYKANLIWAHIRMEGLAKGLIRKFKTMDPATWKTDDLKNILSNEMGIREHPDQPVRVSAMVALKGVIVICRTYDESDANGGGKIENIMEKFKDIGDSLNINHQRVWNVGSKMVEQPTEIGMHAVFGMSVTTMMSLKADVGRSQSRGTIAATIKYDMHLYTQSMNTMMFLAPQSKASFRIVQDRIYHAHAPRTIAIGVNPLKKQLKLSVTRAEYDEPTMFLMHSQTAVTTSAPSLKDSCPSCEAYTVVSKGEDATKTREIYDHESEKFGYYTRAEYFDCEMDIARKNTVGRALAAFMPYNKNPRTPWTSLTMGMRQVRAFLFYFPRAEKCGVYARWSQSRTNAVKEIEVSIVVNRQSKGSRLFFRGASTQIKATIKAKGDTATRAYRLTMAFDYKPANLENKLKVKFVRAPVASLGISAYTVCLSYENKYPDFSTEMFNVDMGSQMQMSGKTMVQYGEGTECSQGDGELKVEFEYSTTEQAREELKKKWYYKDCMALKATPAWSGRDAMPVSETCYMTAYDASNARKYKYDIQFVKLTDRLKNIIKTARTIIRTGMLPYLDIDPEEMEIDTDIVGPFMKLEATLHDDDKLADVTVETSQGVNTFTDYPLRLGWSRSLRNLKFTKTIGRLMKMGIIKPCLATVDSVRTMDNITYSYEASNCWTLISGHCVEQPSYAVFTKKVSGKAPLALKAFIGGHKIEIDANQGQIKLNDAPITLNGADEFEHNVDGVEILKIVKWGSTYNIYSFLRVWVAYDGNFAHIIAAPSVTGSHCGMCGTYNRNKYDEMTGKDGNLLDSADAMAKEWEWKC